MDEGVCGCVRVCVGGGVGCGGGLLLIMLLFSLCSLKSDSSDLSGL